MNAAEFTARMDHLDESTRDLRTAPTMRPPSGEPVSVDELRFRQRLLIEVMSRLQARVVEIDEIIARKQAMA